MTRKEVVNALIAAGNVAVKNLKVKSVSVKVEEEYTRLAITLDKPVRGFVQQADNTYVEGETNVIFCSSYDIGSLLKDDENAAFAVNNLIANPDSFKVILSRAMLTVIPEKVEKEKEYVNPFASNQEKKVIFDHDVILHHVVDIKLSDFGLMKLIDLLIKCLVSD